MILMTSGENRDDVRKTFASTLAGDSVIGMRIIRILCQSHLGKLNSLSPVVVNTALRPQKPDGLLGTERAPLTSSDTSDTQSRELSGLSPECLQPVNAQLVCDCDWLTGSSTFSLVNLHHPFRSSVCFI